MKKETLLEKASTEFRIMKETSAIMTIEPVPYDGKVKDLVRIAKRRRGIKLESAFRYIGSVEGLKEFQPDFMIISELDRVPRLFCFKKHDDVIIKSLIFTNDGMSPFVDTPEQSKDMEEGDTVTAYRAGTSNTIYSTVETMDGKFITYNSK